jgi:hypothetical protein
MSVKSRVYQVTTKSPVMIETNDGNAISYPGGQCFNANPLNPHVVRLLRINAIREVTAREIPNTRVS